MKLHPALRALEALAQEEKLEDFSRRFGVPHIPGYELGTFRAIFHPELSAALKTLDFELKKKPGAAAFAARGRVRRLLGDAAGAARDFSAALDADPHYAPAHAWLAEIDLRRPEAEAGLSKALELEPALHWARLYRGAARLLSRRPQRALEDFKAYGKARPRSALAPLLSGLAELKLRRNGSAARLFGQAVEKQPSCSAAALLRARAAGGGRAFLRACEDAFNGDPDYAHIALFRYEQGQDWGGYLRGLVDFAFDEQRYLAVCVRSLLEDTRYTAYHFEAVERAERLLQAHPQSAWAAALLGRALVRCPADPQRRRRSIELLNRAVELAPRLGWPYAWRALAWVQLGEAQKALRDLEACLKLQPFYYRAHGWRGALLRKLGRPEEGLKGLDRAVAVDEKYPFSLHERSLTRRALGDEAGAVLDLDRAFMTEPRYSWVYAAGRESRRGELERGIAELDRAALKHPQLPSLLVWRGELKLRLRDFSAAFMDFEGAAHLDPHHALAWGWHGWGLCESGKPERAVKLLKRACELEPGVMVFRAWRAEAEHRLGRDDAALKILRDALKERPKTWWLHSQRARCLLAQGRPRQALAAVGEAVALEGRDVDGYYIEAQARLAIADLAGAERAIEKVLAVSPNLGRAYILRAQIRQRQGRFDGVLQDYRTVYDNFPYLFNAEEKKRVEALLQK